MTALVETVAEALGLSRDQACELEARAVWEAVRYAGTLAEAQTVAHTLALRAKLKRTCDENVTLRAKLARIEPRAEVGGAMLNRFVHAENPRNPASDLATMVDLVTWLHLNIMQRTENERSAAARRWREIPSLPEPIDAANAKILKNALAAAVRNADFTRKMGCFDAHLGGVADLLPEFFPADAPQTWTQLALFASYISRVSAATVREEDSAEAKLSIAIKTHAFVVRQAPAPRSAQFHHAPYERARMLARDARVDEWESTRRGAVAQREVLGLALQRDRAESVVVKFNDDAESAGVAAPPGTLLHAVVQLAALFEACTAPGMVAPIVVPRTLADAFCAAAPDAACTPHLARALTGPAFKRCLVKTGEIHDLERQIVSLRRVIDVAHAVRGVCAEALAAVKQMMQHRPWQQAHEEATARIEQQQQQVAL